MTVDIIMCGGKNVLNEINMAPIIYGTRVNEKSHVKGYLHKIDMIDLDWKDYNHDKYFKFIKKVRKEKDRPIKYVVIKDLEDISNLDKQIKFAKLLKTQDYAQYIILPIKIDIDLDLFPDYIRPGLPIPSNYSLKKDEQYNYNAFKKYRGKRLVHTLGGTIYYKILKFVSRINNNLNIGSMDGNGTLFQAIKGLYYNGYEWVYQDDTIANNFKRSLEWMKLQKYKMDECNTNNVLQLYKKINGCMNIDDFF